jgi:hypothetical protein
MFHADRRTDMTKLIADFRDFACASDKQIDNLLTTISSSYSQYPAVRHYPEPAQSIQLFIIYFHKIYFQNIHSATQSLLYCVYPKMFQTKKCAFPVTPVSTFRTISDLATYI